MLQTINSKEKTLPWNEIREIELNIMEKIKYSHTHPHTNKWKKKNGKLLKDSTQKCTRHSTGYRKKKMEEKKILNKRIKLFK